MPLYEYQCDECGHRFEVIQKFSDAPLETCPSCGGPVTKLLSSPAIQFKGSGWYITDYARAGKSEGKKESKSSSAKADSGGSATESSGEKKSETKSESTTESKSSGTPSTSD